MKKILFLLAFIPYLGISQYIDLSKYHNVTDIWIMADSNIFQLRTEAGTNATNIGQNTLRIDSSKVGFNWETSVAIPDSINTRTLTADSATITLLKSDSAVITVLNYMPPHGAYSFRDSASTLNLTQSVWSKLTNAANDLYTALDADGITLQGDSITIITPGDYMFWTSLSFNGNANDVYDVGLRKNGEPTLYEMHRKTSNNDTGNMGFPAVLDGLAAGDDLSLHIRNTANNGDPSFISGQMVITLIHPD